MSSAKRVIKKLLSILRDLEPLFRLIEVCVLGIGAVLISRTANSIAEMQLNVNRAKDQPSFTISQVLEQSADGMDRGNSVLYISNTGGNFSDIEIDTVCYLNLIYAKANHSPMLEMIEHSVMISDFYRDKEWTNALGGLICKVYRDKNWSDYLHLLEEIWESTPILGFGFQQYIKITYQDFLGETHTNYYAIGSDSGRARLLTGDDVEDIFYKHDEEIICIDAYEMNLKDLLRKIDDDYINFYVKSPEPQE